MKNSMASLTFNNSILFRTRDFRNGKYQGLIQQNNLLPQGQGMFLDQNFMLVISNWKNGQANAQTVVIDSYNSLFYGKMLSKCPEGFCCYQIFQQNFVYFYARKSEKLKFLVENTTSKTLTALSFDVNSWNQLTDKLIYYNFSLLGWQGENNLNRRQKALFKAQLELRYENQQQKWSKIEQYFRQSVDVQYKDYKNFIKVAYDNTSNSSKIPAISLVQGRKQMQIRYKKQKSSIVCSIVEHQIKPNNLKIKMLGYKNYESNQIQIYQRYDQQTDSLEQFCNNQEFTYRAGMKRPPVCLKYAHLYYKQSICFSNKFIETKYIHNIVCLLRNIAKYVQKNQYVKRAQILLQNRQRGQTSQQHSLQNIRKQLENKVNRKSKGKYRPLEYSNDKSYKNSQIYNNNDNSKTRALQASSRSPKNISYKQNQSQHKKSFTYLDDAQNVIRRPHNNSRKQSSSKGKYSYLPSSPKSHLNRIKTNPRDDYQPTAFRDLQLKQLTEDYELIESQIKKQTARSRHKFIEKQRTPRNNHNKSRDISPGSFLSKDSYLRQNYSRQKQPSYLPTPTHSPRRQWK